MAPPIPAARPASRPQANTDLPLPCPAPCRCSAAEPEELRLLPQLLHQPLGGAVRPLATPSAPAGRLLLRLLLLTLLLLLLLLLLLPPVPLRLRRMLVTFGVNGVSTLHCPGLCSTARFTGTALSLPLTPSQAEYVNVVSPIYESDRQE